MHPRCTPPTCRLNTLLHSESIFPPFKLKSERPTSCRLGHHKAAAALRKQFNMPDRRLWWAKVSQQSRNLMSC